MTETAKKQVPAYVSFTTLRNFLDLIRTEGVPPVIDPSMLRHMSGATSSQLRTALKYLGATDDEGVTESALEELAQASDEDRPAVMAKVLKSAYGFLFDGSDDFDLEKGTFRQFDDKFRDQGATGATVVKAERFFIQAAEYAQIPISAYITKGMKTRRTQKKTKKTPTSATKSQNGSSKVNNQKVEERTVEKPKKQLENSLLSGKYGLLHKLQIDHLPENGEWTMEEKDAYTKAYGALLGMLVKVVEPDEEDYEDYYDDDDDDDYE